VGHCCIKNSEAFNYQRKKTRPEPSIEIINLL